jgi:hypothetical protein
MWNKPPLIEKRSLSLANSLELIAKNIAKKED